MNIIIVGSGKVGRALTRQLARENHDVVVIDKDPQVVEDLINAFDVNGICGNGACYDIQKQAGVDKADLLISVTQTDELNILCCMLAKKMGCRHSIARVRTPEYSKQLDFMRSGFGISMLVNPEFLAANEIARILRFPSAIKIEPFANGRVELAEIGISEGNDLIGKPVHIIHEKYRVSVLVCAVSESGHTVKVLEKKESRALELGDELSGAEIICGDATDREILNEQGLTQQDAFVALMGRDEENAIISMYAASIHVGKVVTKASRISTDVLSSIGLDTVISAQELATDRILSYVRALHNSEGTAVRTLYRIVAGKVEALEFAVPGDFEYIGVTFRDLKLKSNLIIACIIRHNKIIFPRGADCLEAGDTIVVVTSIESLRSLADIVE